jgi:uncharacterized protein YceK
MKKLLIICAVLMLLCGCAATRTTDSTALYKEELSEKKVNKSEYNYLLNGQRELNEMNKDR